MHTDQWKGYHRVNSSMCFTHKTVNHSENFINPQDETHTQAIESLWGKFKRPGLYPPPCTLPSSVHCLVHLHTGPVPSVYTAFLLKPCQLRFECATMVSQDWGKFCTCCCLGENFALVPTFVVKHIQKYFSVNRWLALDICY